jgi:serine/threonine protein kinase
MSISSFPTVSTGFTAHGYEPIGLIGTGQFGMVYRVRKLNDNNDMLVCKVVSLTSLGEKDRKLAEQEVGLLRAVGHRNIVVLADCFRLGPDQTLAIVMEYCDQGDMRQMIKKQCSIGQYFSETEIMGWFVQILDGLRYLHANRIIHRDMKTSNIFLKGPEPYRCMIGDFGISRVLEETLMAANTVIGTPHYLSPEVCNKQPYTYKSDIWSLGACLYELSSLRLAFKSGNLIELMQQIVQKNHDPLPFGVFSIQFVSLVDKLLSKDPDDRPSAIDLMRDQFVRSFITDKPPSAPMVSVLVQNPPRRPSIRTPIRRIRPQTQPVPISNNEPIDDEFQTAVGEPLADPVIAEGLLPGRIPTN